MSCGFWVHASIAHAGHKLVDVLHAYEHCKLKQCMGGSPLDDCWALALRGGRLSALRQRRPSELRRRPLCSSPACRLSPVLWSSSDACNQHEACVSHTPSLQLHTSANAGMLSRRLPPLLRQMPNNCAQHDFTHQAKAYSTQILDSGPSPIVLHDP